MTPAAIIHGALSDGLTLTLTPVGTIKVAGPVVALERWAPVIRGHKPAVIEALRAPPAPLTTDEEQAIRAWLAHIGEIDPVAIAEVMARCQRDPRALAYTLGQASEVPAPPGPVRCADCAHFERTRHHPNLGHCAQGQPEAVAGLVDLDLRWCGRFSRPGGGPPGRTQGPPR